MKKLFHLYFGLIVFCLFGFHNVLAQTIFPFPQQLCSPNGDIDCNGRVNGADYFYSLFHRGKNTFGADLDGDGVVTVSDTYKLLQQYGETKDIVPSKDVLIVIDSTVYSQISTDISTLISDVKQTLGITVRTIAFSNIKTLSPLTIRERLQQECGTISETGCENIEGVIFVGDVPYEKYFSIYGTTTYEDAPFMYYYEDLDATFAKGSSGYYEGYATMGNYDGPEIYSAWIPTLIYDNKDNIGAVTVNPRSEVEQLHQYFAKHHRFFSKQVVPKPDILIANHAPIISSPLQPTDLLYLYGASHITTIAPNITDNLYPLIPSLDAALETMPEFAYLHSHGSPVDIYIKLPDSFLSLSGLPLIAFSWGCNNGNFDGVFHNSSVALSFIHGKDLGLSYYAKLHSEDMHIPNLVFSQQNDFFRYWNKGNYLGKIYLETSRNLRSVIDYVDARDNQKITINNFYRMSGPMQRIIIGSPFVYSPSIRDKYSRELLP